MKHALHTLVSRPVAAALWLLAAGTVTTQAKDYTEGANCYIVSEAGQHSFIPLKVDGTAINIVKADWLWAEKEPADEAQTLISDVEYKDGRVFFNYSGDREGNAVIAGFDSKGTIVWVWHIWMTDEPGIATVNVLDASKNVMPDTCTVFMDRLIGAIGASKDGVVNGKPEAWSPIVFQWGRSVPFFGGYNSESTALSEPKQFTQINPAYSDTYQWQLNKTDRVSIAGSYANPTTFYIEPESCNWYEKTDNKLWSYEEKTNYDPSPYGWKMPGAAEYADLKDNYEIYAGNSGSWLGIGVTYTDKDGNTSWWRGCGGGRHFEDGIYDAVSSGPTTRIFYWMGEILAGYPRRCQLACHPVATGGDGYWQGNRSQGNHVRCVRDPKVSTTAINAARADAAGLTVKQLGTTLTAYFPAGKFTSLSILDAAGRTVETLTLSGSDSSASLSTQSLPGGFYIVRASSSKTKATRKLVIKNF